MPSGIPTWDETEPLSAPAWDDTKPIGDDEYDQPGVPDNLSERERKRLELMSEMAAARGEAAKIDADLAETSRKGGVASRTNTLFHCFRFQFQRMTLLLLLVLDVLVLHC